MKKRWLVTALFALTLCLCATSAQAAVTIEQVLLLDENLNMLKTVDFDTYTTSLGYRDGVCYVNVTGCLYRSADGGRTWEETDIGQVYSCLQEQKV